MKILIDMNLSPNWQVVLKRNGYEAVHWSNVGDIRAEDSEIMEYARLSGYIVLTHDLDFGAILAATGADAPSVLQIRTQDTLPDAMELIVIAALTQFAPELIAGTLVTVDAVRARARVLPIRCTNP